jgi:hypothetical protein
MTSYTPTLHAFRLAVLSLGAPPQRQSFAEVTCSSASGEIAYFDLETEQLRKGGDWIWRNPEPIDLVLPDRSVSRLSVGAAIRILPDAAGRLGVEITGRWGKPPELPPLVAPT